MKNKFLLIVVLFSTFSFSQEKKFDTQEIEVNSLLKGTLFTPGNASSETKLVILIAGSGPTNRSGNQLGLQNNSLKYLSEGLAKNGIAVYSYDKRIFAQMISGKVDEKSLSFEDFIQDAQEVINYFKLQKKYKKIIIAGHSEGSLIGMIAAKNTADGFISLEGAGRSIDQILSEQYGKQAPTLKADLDKGLAILKTGKTFENKNQPLEAIFRQSIQPYMISWIKFNPQDEIKKLKIPVLIINGTKDIQVSVKDAKLLKAASPNAEFKIIDNMNHIFKEIKGDDVENKKSYNDASLPVITELINIVNQFVKSV